MLTEAELRIIFKSGLFHPLGSPYDLGQSSPNTGREWLVGNVPPKSFKVRKG